MAEVLLTEYLVLDSETTGLPAEGNEALSICVLDQDAQVLFNSLVRPVHHQTWPEAQAIHGIAPADVLRPDVPTLAELAPPLAELLRGRHLVIYNAPYDEAILSDVLELGPPAGVHCCMEAFAEFYGEWSEWHGNYRFQSLDTAAAHVLHRWKRNVHTAEGDCRATLAVWQYVHSAQRRQQVHADWERREEAAEIRRAVARYVERDGRPERERLEAVNRAWTKAYQARLHAEYTGSKAEDSADAFCRHLLGFSVRTWNNFGKMLRLPRYGEGCRRKLPAHLATDGKFPAPMHFLRPVWRPAHEYSQQDRKGALVLPAALWVSKGYDFAPDEPRLTPLYSLRALTLGMDYVPYAQGYPEGHYSASTLRKEFKLKPAQIAALRPSFFKSTQYLDYLLYAWPVPAAAPAAQQGGGGEGSASLHPTVTFACEPTTLK